MGQWFHSIASVARIPPCKLLHKSPDKCFHKLSDIPARKQSDNQFHIPSDRSFHRWSHKRPHKHSDRGSHKYLDKKPHKLLDKFPDKQLDKPIDKLLGIDSAKLFHNHDQLGKPLDILEQYHKSAPPGYMRSALEVDRSIDKYHFDMLRCKWEWLHKLFDIRSHKHCHILQQSES